jgi:hypothetical protein
LKCREIGRVFETKQQCMKTNRGPLFIFGALALILGGAIWYVLRPADVPSAHTASRSAAAGEEAPPSPGLPPIDSSEKPAPVPQAPQPKTAAARNPAPKTEIAQWEYRIDEALRSQADHSAIALSILSQVPSMPAEGQTTAAQHIVNLIADKDYLQLLPYIKNPRMEAGFQEIVVAESLNRPDEVKLPVLLNAARIPKHPMAETALSVLSVLLDANHGSDWTKWEESVNKALNKVSPNGAPAASAAQTAAPENP